MWTSKALITMSAVLAGTGCGSDPEPFSDREQITGQVLGFWRDLAEEEWDSACSRLSVAGWAHVTPEPDIAAERDECLDSIGAFAADKPSLEVALDGKSMKVRRIRFGDKRIGLDATAELEVGRLPDRHDLVKVDGKWRISSGGWPLRD